MAEREKERERGRNWRRGRDGEKRSENYRRGCILSFGRVHQQRYFFSFLLPQLLPRLLSLSGRPARIIRKLLT